MNGPWLRAEEDKVLVVADSLINYLTNNFEKRTITLPNAIINVIDFNNFSIT